MNSAAPPSNTAQTYIISDAVFPFRTQELKRPQTETLHIKSTSSLRHQTTKTSILERISWRQSRTVAEAQMEPGMLLRARINDYHPSCQQGWTFANERLLGTGGKGYFFDFLGRTFAWTSAKPSLDGDTASGVTEHWKLIEFSRYSSEVVNTEIEGELTSMVAVYSQMSALHSRRKRTIQFMELLAPDLELLCITMVLTIAAEDRNQNRMRVQTDVYARLAAMGNF